MKDLNILEHGQRVQAILRSIKASVVAKVLDISEFSTNFNTTRFIRVIIYHLLYFFFGPLIVVPIISFFDSFSLTQNMGFWFGTNDKFSFVAQLLIHMASAYMLITQLLSYFGV